MTDELKPCPFCGGPVTLERTADSYDRIHGNRKWWGVKCRNTINLGGTCAIEANPSASEEAAITRWNRRAPTDSQAGRDAVKAASDTKRLDALEKLVAESMSVKLYGSTRKASFCVEPWGSEDEPADYPSLRAAIDALSTTAGRAE